MNTTDIAANLRIMALTNVLIDKGVVTMEELKAQFNKELEQYEGIKKGGKPNA